ncbi:hypothetical protein N0V82_004663 [Gnomoniopsis sp. IMI 355080]|nr:hypothetical protein N0V82_004663 [Gnomoniopsis sp. IMI 355080]
MATQTSPLLVLPRPGAADLNHGKPRVPITAPTQEAMTSAFGVLLPSAQYLTMPRGRVAYYVYPLSVPSPSPTPFRVLMVHGVQTPALGLQPLAEALRSRFPGAHIALLDLWGHGLSDTPQEPHTPRLFHDLLDAVLTELNWPTAHLLGFSFGGATVVGYTASSTERAAKVASLTLVAPAGLFRLAQFDEKARQNYLGLEARDEEGAKDWVLDFLEGGKLIVPNDWRERVGRGEVVAEAVKEWEMSKHQGHVASVVAIFRDGGVMDNHDAFVKVSESGVPYLGVVGELDGVCSADDLQQVGLPKVVVVPQIGHEIVRQKVTEVAQAIEEFWKTLC